MNIVAIVSSIIIIVGCFMPWIQLGALFQNRGIDNPDGAIMLVAGIISGALGIYNQNRNENKNTWVYIVVGALGLIVAFLDLSEVNERAKGIAENFGEFNKLFGGGGNISMTNFVGSGLYIVSFGSIGLLLTGLGVFKSKSQENNVTPPVQSSTVAEIKAPQNYKEEIDPIEKENKEYKEKLIVLNEMIKKEKDSLFRGSKKQEIINLTTDLCDTKENGEYLLTTYKQLNDSDLVASIKKLTSNYDSMKQYLRPLIELEIIEENYPHERINK